MGATAVQSGWACGTDEHSLCSHPKLRGSDHLGRGVQLAALLSWGEGLAPSSFQEEGGHQNEPSTDSWGGGVFSGNPGAKRRNGTGQPEPQGGPLHSVMRQNEDWRLERGPGLRQYFLLACPPAFLPLLCFLHSLQLPLIRPCQDSA